MVISKTLKEIECGECTIDFAIPEIMYHKRLQDGRTFFCPAGHQISWSDNENDRLRETIKEKEQQLERTARFLSATEHRNQKLLKEQKRVARRVTNGVCPCCNRTFINLQRHMKTKHPEKIT